MTTDCKHQRIQTWRFEDSAEVAGLWSCADCGRRFEPVAPVVDRASLTRHDINKLMADAGWQNSALRQADLDGVERVIRAIEAAHGIIAAGN